MVDVHQSDDFEVFFDTMQQECHSLQSACQKISDQKDAVRLACQKICECSLDRSQRIIVCGMGKAGIIARKIAATMSSTGTAAMFLHPADGLHGDMGFAKPDDVAILFSYSGETIEIVRLGRQFQKIGCQTICVTKSRESSIGSRSSITIETGTIAEACYMDLAPTSSTTVMLAIGDALALTVAQKKGFQPADFARNHPAGTLGLRFQTVESIMRRDSRLVRIPSSMPLFEVVSVVSAAKTGAAILTKENGVLDGIFTDGDLRRALLNGEEALRQPVREYASRPCHSIEAEASLSEAMNLFSKTQTEDLPVVRRNDSNVVGLLCLKDINLF